MIFRDVTATVGRTPMEVHRRTIAVEVWEDTQGAVDVFVCATERGFVGRMR